MSDPLPDLADWEQLRLIAQVPPEKRPLASVEAAEWIMAGLRGALRAPS
ncbi:MAG: hypothetical protein ACFLMY_06865 [Candidatus Brachytrichaceae bacterium NZ_4S206]